MKKMALSVIGILSVASVAAFVWFVYVPIYRHNQIADVYLAELSEQPLSENDRLLDRFSEIGLLVGNGNHCDILCITLWESDTPLPELKLKSGKSKNEVLFFHDEDALEKFSKTYCLHETMSRLKRQRYTYLLYSFHSL